MPLGTEWDPAANDPFPHADFTENPISPETQLAAEILVGLGLTALVALAATGVGAFFTVEAALAGEVAGTAIEYGGETYFFAGTLTEGQQAVAAVIEAGLWDSEPVAVNAILSSWGFAIAQGEGAALMEAAALVALNNYTSPYPVPPGPFYNFPWAGHTPTGGGDTTPPGFPGFFGGGVPWSSPPGWLPGFGNPGGSGPSFWVCHAWGCYLVY